MPLDTTLPFICPDVSVQIERLAALGVPERAGCTPDEFRTMGESLADHGPNGFVVVHPSLVPASRLAPLLSLNGKPGFVVSDMDDLDAFIPISGISIPAGPLYVIHDVDRGDEMSNWSPDEALPHIAANGRRPLTVNEGISWLLQQPGELEPGHCFMTIASRKNKNKNKNKGRGLDARTPAIWISGGTGRDGRANKGAPKVGWCWAGNRHTWLGFASASADIS